MSPKAFENPIKNARLLFDYAEKAFGHKLTLLDLGGGFPGSLESTQLFDSIASQINSTIDTYFPVDSQVTIIAEPGRYFPCSAYTLCVNVIAKRVIADDDSKEHFMYYINDGIFSTFNCIVYDYKRNYPPIILNVS